MIDAGTVRRWLGILHGDTPGWLQIAHTGDWSGEVFPTNALDAATAYVTQLDTEGIYCRVTSLTAPPEPGRRGGAANSAALPALWADIDIAGPGHEHTPCAPPYCSLGAPCSAHTTIRPNGGTRVLPLPADEQVAQAIASASGLPDPTIWIHSGGGLYPIWLLTEPWLLTGDGQLDAAKALARDWQRVLEYTATSKLGCHYGAGVGDLARVLRIPGTVNRKAGLARPCRIVGATPHRYTVHELQAALAAAMAAIAPPAPAPAAPSLLSTVQRPAGALSPGDDYATRTTWAQILEPAGWTEHYRHDDVTYWTRPGKPAGISASTNALGTDRLHVFTTSANPLEGGESYSKLGALAALQHGGDHAAAARALAKAGYGSPLPDPAAENRQLIKDLLGGPIPDPPPSAPASTAGGRGAWTAELDVSNPAEAADWLRTEAGRGRLAGLFRRLDTVVHTPREGEDGYQALSDSDSDDDGPAQVRPIGDSALASRISYTYGCYRLVKRGEDYVPVQALFSRTSARTALDVPDMLPSLRPLRGVIHSPVFRADSTLLAAPGYDPPTGLLYLPEPGLTVPPVPDRPTGAQLADAVGLVDEMLAGFPFVSEHHHANYLGALLTPLLRAVTPPPYKLHAIEAHQPGSGKTLLANLARHIHGGVFRAELPEDDAELRKQITAILSITTGPVVVLDNVSGALRSSTLAGLLTSAQWDDRPLGSTSWTRATNDRLWTITGNNLSIGGDLPRRTLRTVIDPGQPNPETRTGFAILDLEGWVRQRRGELLHALLTIVAAWVAAGMPLPTVQTSDGYARWTRTIAGILAHAEITGEFDHPSTRIEVGTDDDDWATFLAAVHRVYGDRIWTVKELLADVDTGTLINPGRIALDALPGDLEAKARLSAGPSGVAKSLGMWLRNRDGRWAGGLTVRSAGDQGHVKKWRIWANDQDQGGLRGLGGLSQPTRAPDFTDPLQSVTSPWGATTGMAGTDPLDPSDPLDLGRPA